MSICLPLRTDQGLYLKLQKYATTVGVRNHFILLAAWASTLRYYTGQSSVAFQFDVLLDVCSINKERIYSKEKYVFRAKLYNDTVFDDFLSQNPPRFLYERGVDSELENGDFNGDFKCNTEVLFHCGPKANEHEKPACAQKIPCLSHPTKLV